MNKAAAELLAEVRAWQRERPVRDWRSPAKPEPPRLIEPMDEATRDTVVAEVMGTQPPPVIVPVWHKYRRRS
jgi:hypothetical protein